MEKLELIKQILLKENIKFNNITKSTSGFTNLVYFVDDKYVVKIVGDNTNPKKLLKEIKFYTSVKLDNIPNYIASGKLNDCDYLIIEKLQGKSLYDIWHALDDSTRVNLVKQICDILKQFHKLDYTFLSGEDITFNWQQKWIVSFNKNIEILERKGFEVEFLKEFRDKKLPVIFSESDMCLVYNDAHFDNFLFDGKTLKLIDFDRIKAYSVDYELLIIKSMLDAPHKFASEVQEPFVNIEHYTGIYELLKQEYPRMFNFTHINSRVFIYQFIYNLGNAYEWKHDDWCLNELNKFKLFFDIK